jgi:hypothetical protein
MLRIERGLQDSLLLPFLHHIQAAVHDHLQVQELRSLLLGVEVQRLVELAHEGDAEHGHGVGHRRSIPELGKRFRSEGWAKGIHGDQIERQAP